MPKDPLSDSTGLEHGIDFRKALRLRALRVTELVKDIPLR